MGKPEHKSTSGLSITVNIPKKTRLKVKETSGDNIDLVMY